MSLLRSATPVSLEQRLEKAYGVLLSHPQFRWMASVMLVGGYYVVEAGHWVNTAATNGKDCWYNREFCDQYGDAELRFIVLHENYHKLFKHMLVWQHLFKKSADTANRALDYAINLRIMDMAKQIAKANPHQRDWIKEPLLKDGSRFICLDEKFRGWDEAKIFYYLLDNPQENQKPKDGQGNPVDDFDSHDWESAQTLPEEEKRELEKQINEAIRQGEMIAARNGSGGLNQEVKDLTKPQIRWQDVLREFVKAVATGGDYTTWSRPNRRFMSVVYAPRPMSQTVGEGLCAMDRSISVCHPKYLSKFLGEVQSICLEVKPEKLHLMYWDTQVCGHEQYTQAQLPTLIQSTKPKGGGGTDAACVPNYMCKENITPQFAIIFTDGYVSSWGNWDCPVLWCIVDNKSAAPPSGKVVHIDTSTLR